MVVAKCFYIGLKKITHKQTVSLNTQVNEASYANLERTKAACCQNFESGHSPLYC